MTRLTSISLAGTIGKNYYGISRDPGIVTKTLGTNSRDYSTISLWEADLDSASVYMEGDEAVGECYNDSTFSPFSIDGGITIGLKSITLKAAAGESHDGTAGTGVKVQTNANWQRVAYLSSANKPVKVEGIELVMAHRSVHAMMEVGAYRHNKVISKCLMHDSYWPTPSPSQSTTAISTGFWYCFVTNNIVYNVKYGISSNNYYTGTKVINNTAYTHGGPALFTREATISKNTIKNNLLFRSDGAAAFAQSGSAPNSTPNWSNNMIGSSYIPGTDNYTDVSINDMFISNISGSEDFHLRSQFDYVDSAPAIGLGLNLSLESFLSEGVATGFNVGLATQDIDHLSRAETWDIGADQTPTTSTKSIGTNSREYSTITLWEADLDNPACYFYEDRAVGQCYNDSTFYESLNINGGAALGIYSIRLEAALTEHHDGTSGTGVMISPTISYSPSSITANMPVSFEYLTFDQRDMYGSTMTINSTSYLFQMSRCIMHSGLNFMLKNDGVSILDNNIFYDSSNSGGQGASVFSSGTTDSINNTLADHVYGFKRSAGTCTVVNSIVVSDASVRAQDLFGTITQKYNISSDAGATGTGSIVSQAYGLGLFKSILAGSEDYHINAESSAVRAGYNALLDYPSYTTVAVDVDGITRSANQDWDIGADQSASGGGMMLFGIG